MDRITPISPDQQKLVVDETLKYLQMASHIFHQPFKPITILFNLRGLASGMFCLTKDSALIRYNPYIFAKYFDYCLANTVPHEVAHYVIHNLYGLKAARPHGKEWKELMLRFGATPARTYSLNLDGIPIRRQKRYPYRCNCSDHLISSIRHNKVVSGQARYFCRLCKGPLKTSDTES